jgi:hypothetical protein
MDRCAITFRGRYGGSALTESNYDEARPFKADAWKRSWEESVVEGFSEFPIVTQWFKVFLGDDLVYEGQRQFGSSFEDPTHTDLGGRWVAIRVDDDAHAVAE